MSSTTRIRPGAEILGNYNEGRSKFKYWRHLETLHSAAVPSAMIVKCKCRSAKGGRTCPNRFAYDRRVMREA
jgi:hypothetical protein